MNLPNRPKISLLVLYKIHKLSFSALGVDVVSLRSRLYEKILEIVMDPSPSEKPGYFFNDFIFCGTKS